MTYSGKTVNGGDTTSLDITGLDLSTQYSVRIASVNGLGTGNYSGIVSATTYGCRFNATTVTEKYMSNVTCIQAGDNIIKPTREFYCEYTAGHHSLQNFRKHIYTRTNTGAFMLHTPG